MPLHTWSEWKEKGRYIKRGEHGVKTWRDSVRVVLFKESQTGLLKSAGYAKAVATPTPTPTATPKGPAPTLDDLLSAPLAPSENIAAKRAALLSKLREGK